MADYRISAELQAALAEKLAEISALLESATVLQPLPKTRPNRKGV